MYDILDISRYVLYYAKKCGHGLSVLQLMKILYFVQAQFLISRKKRAFSDEIVAMDWGPVERKVWSHYKSCGNGYIPVLLGINFVKEEKEYTKTAEKIYIEDIKLINGIVDLLLGYDNTYLMSIIRKQPPFMKGLKNFPGYEISDKDMMTFSSNFLKRRAKSFSLFFRFWKKNYILTENGKSQADKKSSAVQMHAGLNSRSYTTLSLAASLAHFILVVSRNGELSKK